MPGTSRAEKMVQRKDALISELVRIRGEILAACETLEGDQRMQVFIGIMVGKGAPCASGRMGRDEPGLHR